MKLQKWNRNIVNKKSGMTIILNQYDEDTRVEIALISSNEDNLEAENLLNSLQKYVQSIMILMIQTYFLVVRLTKIIKHHFRPITIVKELLSAHLTDDAIWDNTNPCNVSLDTIDGAENAANIDVTKESTVTTTTSMSIEDDKPWLDAHEDFDWWYNTPETMNDHKNMGRSTKYSQKYKYHQ